MNSSEKLDYINSKISKKLSTGWRISSEIVKDDKRELVVCEGVRISITGEDIKICKHPLTYTYSYTNIDTAIELIMVLLSRDVAYQMHTNNNLLRSLCKKIDSHHKYISEQIQYAPNGEIVDLLKDDFEKLSAK
jgi:hypothetical protein